VIRQIQLDDSKDGASESIDEGGGPVMKCGDAESMSSGRSRGLNKITSQGEEISDFIIRNEMDGRVFTFRPRLARSPIELKVTKSRGRLFSDVTSVDDPGSDVPNSEKRRRPRNGKAEGGTRKCSESTETSNNDEYMSKVSDIRYVTDHLKDAFLDIKAIVRRLHLISKKDPKIQELATAADRKADMAWKRIIDLKFKRTGRKIGEERPEEVEASTQTSPIRVEMDRGEDGRPKRKKISPLDKRKDLKKKKSGDGNSFAEVCGSRSMRADTIECESCESED
jgi:hypothetical protein